MASGAQLYIRMLAKFDYPSKVATRKKGKLRWPVCCSQGFWWGAGEPQKGGTENGAALQRQELGQNEQWAAGTVLAPQARRGGHRLQSLIHQLSFLGCHQALPSPASMEAPQQSPESSHLPVHPPCCLLKPPLLIPLWGIYTQKVKGRTQNRSLYPTFKAALFTLAQR